MNSPSNSNSRFHLLVRLLHWVMALAILTMMFIGVGMASTAEPAYTALVALHRPLGALILALALIRLAVRLKTGAPGLPADLPRIQVLMAKASHAFLYLAMIGMPIIGWAMLSAGGFPVTLSPGMTLPPILPHDLALYAFLRTAHTIVAFAFFALILAHLSAALHHALVRRDGVFGVMTWGKRQD